MKKKSFKRVFSKAFVVGLAALAVTGVKAQTLNEKVNEKIEDGSYIIGISKFTPDQILTGNKVFTATANDMAFNKDVLGYTGDGIYYFLFNEWFKIDDANNYNKVTDTAKLAQLNSRDVYYVNNVEKELKIYYKADVPSGSTLEFVTDKPNKPATYDAESGVITIPATVKTVTVKVDGGVVDTFTKVVDANDNTEFDFVGSGVSTGTISADAKFTSLSNATVNGNTITVTGPIAWSGSSVKHGADQYNTAKSGHRIGITVTLPQLTDIDEVDGIEVEFSEVGSDTSLLASPLSWADSMDKNSNFWFTPVVEEGKEYTLAIKWLSGVTQTFTIKVNGTFAEIPEGIIAGQPLVVEDEDGNEVTKLTASVKNNDTVTYTGESIGWASDNAVTVYVTPSSDVTDQAGYNLNSAVPTYTSVIKNTAYNAEDEFTVEKEYKDSTAVNADHEVVTLEDGTQVLAITVPLTENTVNTKGRVRTVTIAWNDDNEYVQKFDVVLADSVKFEYPVTAFDSVTATGDEDHDYMDYLPNDVEAVDVDTVTVDRFIEWDKDNGGNRVTAKIVASGFSSSNANDDIDSTYAELDYLTVRVNGEVVKYEASRDENDNPVMEPVTFAMNHDGMNGTGEYTWDFVVQTGGEYKLEVLWNGEKVVRTFTVKVTAGCETAIGGYMEVATEGLRGISTSEKDISVQGTYNNETKAYNPIPYDYDLNSNAVTAQLSNNRYSYNASTLPTVTVKVGSAAEEEAPVRYDSDNNKVLADIKVQKRTTTVVTVAWDAENKQTFNVSGDSTQVTYAEKAVGTVAHTSGTQSNDKKTVTVTDAAVAWDNVGYYTLGGTTITAPQKHSVTYTVEDENGKEVTKYVDDDAIAYNNDALKVVISGGKYSDNEEGYEEFTTESRTFTLSTGTVTQPDDYDETDVTSLKTSTLSVPLSLRKTDTNVTFKVTVYWTENYSETFTVKAVRPVFAATAAATLTINEVDSENDAIAYADVMAPDSIREWDGKQLYSVNAAIAEAVDGKDISKVEVTDLNPDHKVTQLNGKLVTTNTARVIDAADYADFPIYFGEEDNERTATVTVTWDDNSVQVITVDADAARMPVYTLSASINKDLTVNDADEFVYEYSKTMNVNSTVKLVASKNNINGAPSYAITDEKLVYEYDTTTHVVEVDENGVVKAVAPGVATVTITGEYTDAEGTAKQIVETVTITVVDPNEDKVTVTATANKSADGTKVEITATPVGGHKDTKYVVYVAQDFYDKEEKVYTTSTILPAVERLNSGKYVVELPISKDTDYRYTVYAVQTSVAHLFDDATTDDVVEGPTYDVAGSAVDPALVPYIWEYSVGSTEIEEVKHEHTVKFVANGSTITKNVTAGDAVLVPEIDRKADTDKYFYILKGWYSEDCFEDGKLKDTYLDGLSLDINGDVVVSTYDDAVTKNLDGDNYTDHNPDLEDDPVDIYATNGSVTLKAVWYRIPKKTN